MFRAIANAFEKQRVEEKLGHPLTPETSLHLVRSVAPNKEMYCISFRLPREVAFSLTRWKPCENGMLDGRIKFVEDSRIWLSKQCFRPCGDCWTAQSGKCKPVLTPHKKTLRAVIRSCILSAKSSFILRLRSSFPSPHLPPVIPFSLLILYILPLSLNLHQPCLHGPAYSRPFIAIRMEPPPSQSLLFTRCEPPSRYPKANLSGGGVLLTTTQSSLMAKSEYTQSHGPDSERESEGKGSGFLT